MSGPTGRIVDHLLQLHGHPGRERAWVTNVVSCTCDKVPASAAQACRPRLEWELARVDPGTVILAAKEAVETFLDGGLADHRGQRLATEDGVLAGRLIVASPNPAIVLRESTTYPDLVSDFRRALVPPKPFDPPKVDYYERDESFASAIQDLREHVRHGVRVLACDIETTGLDIAADLVTIAFSYAEPSAPGGCKSLCLDLRGRTHPDPDLQELLCDPRLRCLWHNGQFDTKILRQHGYQARIDEDSLLLSYCLDERQRVHSLDYLIQNLLDWPLYESEEVKDAKKHSFTEEPEFSIKVKKYAEKGKYKGATHITVTCLYQGVSDFTDVYRYNGMDTAGCHRVYQELVPRVESEGVKSPYDTLLIPGANALRDVEAHGVLIDAEAASFMLDVDVYPRLNELNWIAECNVGQPINMNSHVQVAKYIYDVLGLHDPLFRPGKMRSVDAANREQWLLDMEQHAIGREVTDIEAWLHDHKEVRGNQRAHEFLVTLDEFKKLDKLRNTYIEKLPKMVDADGRLRCNLLLHGTTTGRLSSSKPNLQNIPRYDPSAKYPVPNVKKMFVAREGHVIMQADYSQCELRTAAILSGDEHMIALYEEGHDLHGDVARAYYGDGFTKEQRTRAKTCNFAMLYGAGAHKLSQLLHIPQSEARGLITTFWKQFPGLRKWSAGVHKHVRAEGEEQSPFGRKRRFHVITDQNLDEVLREAVNFHIQSTAFDFCLHSVIELVQNFYPVWLTVHDSILLEVPMEHVEDIARDVRGFMMDAPLATLGWNQIPFEVDIAIGHNWGELEEMPRL